jgi:hypothetical protein
MTVSAPGYYVVDVGKLIGVFAAGPEDAAQLVKLPIFGRTEEIPASEDVRAVYRIGEECEVLEVYQ